MPARQTWTRTLHQTVRGQALQELDLTPEGLADAPAAAFDPESLVSTDATD